jgi:hypothetical protein
MSIRLCVAFALTALLQAGCCWWPHCCGCGWHHCCNTPNEDAFSAVVVSNAPWEDSSADADKASRVMVSPEAERPVLQ